MWHIICILSSTTHPQGSTKVQSWKKEAKLVLVKVKLWRATIKAQMCKCARVPFSEIEWKLTKVYAFLLLIYLIKGKCADKRYAEMTIVEIVSTKTEVTLGWFKSPRPLSVLLQHFCILVFFRVITFENEWSHIPTIFDKITVVGLVHLERRNLGMV